MNTQGATDNVLAAGKYTYALHLEEMLYRNPDMPLTKEQTETITWFRNELDIMARDFFDNHVLS